MNIADDALSTAAARRARPSLRVARLIVAALAGAVLTLLAIGILTAVRRGPLTPLTATLMQQAQQRWEQQGIDDYDIQIRVTGRQASVYRVEVRDGQAQNAWRDGEPLAQRRTWATWTVPGMFGTLKADLQNIQRLEAGDTTVPRLTVQVQFDPQFHYPKRYVRVESVKAGGNPEVTWEVIEFRPNPEV